MTIQKGRYSAGLMSESFWFHEFKQVVKLRAEGLTQDEIKVKCINENLFGYAKEYRLNRVVGYILMRVHSMVEILTNIFMNSDIQTQKLINLITILRKDRLFFEFIYEVYREKVMIGVPTMEIQDVNVLFSRKESQNEEVASWKESTKKHLRANYLNFMADANLLTVSNKKRTITPPLMDASLEYYLKIYGESDITKAIMGAYDGFVGTTTW